jgi:hypothetical protein
MSLPPATEQTLGLLAEVRASRSLVGGARRLVRPESPHRASLGTAFIGVGASLVCALSAIYGFSMFVAHWQEYPNPIPVLAAWVLLITALAAAFITSSIVGDRLPDWMFSVFLGLLAAVIVLDVVAVWDLHDFGEYATASLTAGTGLLLVLTLRRPMDIVVAVTAIGIALLTVVLINTRLEPEVLPAQLTALAFAVLPVVIGVVIVRGFRSMVQVELDRVLVQSTVSAPRFAVGMLASEELARLDLAAEELLDSVATGRIALPLRPKTASVAASLATELRLHLIEGRRETWLYHAITESELLGRSVTLTDKGSLAGLLDANQRDGLLAAVWLLVNDHAKKTTARTVQVNVGPIVATTPAVHGRKLRIPIVITTTGVPRNRVDPSTWDAIRRVGRYSDSSQNASLRVEIECFVDNPADL